jgi:hypothetical protein
MQLAIGIRLKSIPTPGRPSKIIHAPTPTFVQGRRNIHKSLRFVDQTSQDIWCERIDGKDFGGLVCWSRTRRFLKAQAGIVDYGVKGADLVDFGSQGLRFLNAR